MENPVDIYKPYKPLKNAILAANLKHTQCNILLKTLREFPFNLNFLLRDARTILNTPIIVVTRFIQRIAGGEYLYIGFKLTLEKKLQSIPANMMPEIIIIDFSTDGAKVDKGKRQLWPFQYRIVNIEDKRPVIADVFVCIHKPTNAFDFFDQFISEIIDAREEGGIIINNKRIPLRIRCFIADAPARAFALNHAGHNSSNPCSKCKIEGRHYMGRMVFEGIGHSLRTDEEYRNIIDGDHHRGRSPLAEIVGLVMQVPFEGMHLVWIDNVKKALLANIEGKYKVHRLPGRKLDILDSKMVQLKMYCPSDFNRKPNAMTAIHSFKATELR